MIAAERGITKPRHIDLGPGTPNTVAGVPMLHIEIPPRGRKSSQGPEARQAFRRGGIVHGSGRGDV